MTQRHELDLGNFEIISNVDKTDKGMHIMSDDVKALTLEKTTLLNGDEQIGLVLGNNGEFDNQLSSPSALLELKSTTGALLLSRLTEIERNSLEAPINGMVIFNTTKKRVECYENRKWVTFGSGTVTSITYNTDVTNRIVIFADAAGTVVTESSASVRGDTLNAQKIVAEEVIFRKADVLVLRSTDVIATNVKVVDLDAHSIKSNTIDANEIKVNKITAEEIDCDNVTNLTFEKVTLKAMSKHDRDHIHSPKLGMLALVKENEKEYLSIYLNNKWTIITTI